MKKKKKRELHPNELPSEYVTVTGTIYQILRPWLMREIRGRNTQNASWVYNKVIFLITAARESSSRLQLPWFWGKNPQKHVNRSARTLENNGKRLTERWRASMNADNFRFRVAILLDTQELECSWEPILIILFFLPIACN